MGERVEIVEVGPRDGLQNEPGSIPVTSKVALIDALSDVGFARIEAASFVSEKWVPQMAGSAEVMAGIFRNPGTRYAALVPNFRGLEAALAAGVDDVAVFASASESFSKANINATIDESLTRYRDVISAALDAGLRVRGYVSCVTDCPYEGAISPATVVRVASELASAGCFEVSLGETLGHGTPDAVDEMLAAVVTAVPAEMLAGHFHDTGDVALSNIGVALDRGVRVFDASVGGLGGCPYAPGAAGNVASGKVAAFLSEAGYLHGLNVEALARARDVATDLRTRTP